MFLVNIDHQYASRSYKAESLVDAMELFDLLSKTCKFVQVWKGSELIAEYNTKYSREMQIEYEYYIEADETWAEKAEAYIHNKPLCG